jgi:glucosamine kinase
MDLVLGIDAGGTSSRASVVTLSGTRVGYGRAGGGNPTAHGTATACANIGSAARQALGSCDPGRVRAAVVGTAGLAAAVDTAGFSELWRTLGLTITPCLIGDVPIAFSAGTAEPSGTVLISGTGAIAARIDGHAATAVSDGLGWLVGDEGSGFWLGREAARRALERLRHTSVPYGPLTEAVVDRLLGSAPPGPDAVESLIREIYARAPLALAELAPLVTACIADPLARDIVDKAADHLVVTVARIRPGGDTTPLVLAGSVLTGDGPVGCTVRERLAERWAAPVTVAGDAADAAAWLATRDHVADPAALHDRIMG